MRILRVPWIGHDGTKLQKESSLNVVTSIYSVDFHPTEPLVATAGGGVL